MRTNTQQTVNLGDLVVAVYDEAIHYSVDPNEVSFLAGETVTHILQNTWNFMELDCFQQDF